MWRLLYPLRYFSLHNKEKSRIDVWPTIFLSVLMSIPFVVLKGSNFFAVDGFLDKIIPLSSALTAFYVAALVAVATFSHPDLDKEITLGAIYLVEKSRDGIEKSDALTRRQFACIIFGYLAFISMAISVAAAIAVTIGITPIGDLVFNFKGVSHHVPTWKVVNGFTIFLFNVSISHMMVVTGLGIYYLMEKIHSKEDRILTKKS